VTDERFSRRKSGNEGIENGHGRVVYCGLAGVVCVSTCDTRLDGIEVALENGTLDALLL